MVERKQAQAGERAPCPSFLVGRRVRAAGRGEAQEQEQPWAS